jgi:hypothetical protein
MAMADYDSLVIGATADAPSFAGLVDEGGYADDSDDGYGGGFGVDAMMEVMVCLVVMVLVAVRWGWAELGGGRRSGRLAVLQERLAWPRLGRRRSPVSFIYLLVLAESLLVGVYRAGLPSVCAQTGRAVPTVQSRMRAAAMDAVIRNVKGDGGTTRVDGVSTRASALGRRAGWVESR